VPNAGIVRIQNRGYPDAVAYEGQYCPVSRGAHLIGDRWAILIVRELMFGPLRFNEFDRGLPGISRSVLSQRLRRLAADGIIAKAADGRYELTEVGRALKPVLRELGEWVAAWLLEDPAPAQLDPELLMLYISRHVVREALPDRRTVVRFELSGGVGAPGTRHIWLTLERHDVSICLHDPCLPVDLTVHARVADLYRVYIGRARLVDELAAERVVLEGLPAMCRDFSRWMKWSDFAPAAARGLERQG
jgi:DNA-binding HxlR family transcriptional regulator